MWFSNMRRDTIVIHLLNIQCRKRSERKRIGLENRFFPTGNIKKFVSKNIFFQKNVEKGALGPPNIIKVKGYTLFKWRFYREKVAQVFHGIKNNQRDHPQELDKKFSFTKKLRNTKICTRKCF